MPGPGEDGPLSVESLNSTSYNVEGDGPKTEPSEVRRTWYGKKKKELKDGTGTLKPVRQVKHRKYARFKKILNIGEKLKPLGLDSSEPDNQSQARDQPDDAAGAIPQAEHVNQDNARSEAINKNLETAAETRDLYIQVSQAKNLRALDENGKSDPYVKIRVGKAVQESKVIDQELHPVWDETFVFPTKRAEACLLSAHPKIIFELWDKDFLSPDEFLGQAHIDLSEIEVGVDAIDPLWLPLYGEKHGKEVHGLGEVRVAAWFSRSGATDNDRMSDKSSDMKLSSLCNPPGIPKKLPVVIHTEGNCLYEEPCVRYLSLHIGQIRSMDQIEQKDGANEAEFQDAKPAGLLSRLSKKGSYRSLTDEPEGGFFSDLAKNTESLFNAEMSGATAWRGSDTESEISDSSSGNGEEDSKSKDDGEDPFDEEEETLENPLQSPNAEADSDAPSARPVEDKRLFFEVSFGHQRRRTKIGRLESRSFTGEARLPYASTVPMKPRSFKLLLCEVDRARKRSQLVAIAFVPLSDLMHKSETSENGEWFQLHDYNQRVSGKPVPFGAVQLKLYAADSDNRRALYNQPLLEDADERPAGRSLSNTSSKSSIEYEQTPCTTENGQAGHSQGDLSKEARQSRGRAIRLLESVRDGCDRFQQQSVSMEGKSGIRLRLWQALELLLLSLQLLLALLTSAAFLCEQGWQAGQPQLRKLWDSLRKQQHRRSESGSEVHPPYQLKKSDRPLGIFKFVIGSLKLEEDVPQGAYFLVFKCGPHWGQSSLLKGEKQLDWNWEVQLPLHEPYTVLLLNLFRDQHRKNTGRLRSNPPKLVGKLRLRLNTLAPGLQYEADLPLLADRKEGGTHKATLSLEAKIMYMDELPVLMQYFEAPQPSEIYELGLAEGNIAKQLDFEYKRLTLQWLKTTNPPISSGVAKEVIGLERQQFVFSRAKANWARCSIEKDRFTWIMRFWERNQEWENPVESVALMCGLVTFSFYPAIVLVSLLLWIVAYALLTAPKRPGKPQEMYTDPEDEDDEEEVEEQGGIGQLRKKYLRLVKVALAVQNYLGDLAEVLERLHSLITWADPRATLIFLFACILGALAIATFSLPVVLSIGLCYTVRPPQLRPATPPPPAAFFMRLPTRSDQII